MDEVGDIKATVSMIDICEKYGIEVNRGGFASCPFHSERTPSMKIYPGQRGYCCFGCGKSGDVIDFVKEYFSISFKDAVRKINDDFGLHLLFDDHSDYRARIAAGRATYERKKKYEAEQKLREEIEKEYWDIYDDWLKLGEIMDRHRPADQDDDMDPIFIRALILHELYECELEAADARRYRYYNERRNK